MNSIKTTEVNNIEIEYTVKNNESYYIYNQSNNRTIVGNQEVINYLENVVNIDSSSPLFDFIEKKAKFNILDFNILSFNLENKTFINISSFANITSNKIICIIAFLLTLIFIGTPNDLNDFQINDWKHAFTSLIFMYICGFFIILFHELSHMHFYANYFHTNKNKFGFTLRYFFMLLVFINVPFINAMDIKSQKIMVLAGIKTQIFIAGVLSTLALIFPTIAGNIYFQIPFFLNIGIIMVNILPFFKLDGFWYTSIILGVPNYMNYFKNMITKNVKFNFFIFLIGVINTTLIILFIVWSIYRIYLFMT
ncbi:hypothetical protein ACE3LZ_12640 [Staphylococcus saprophyticus]|uniref:hypothetical protein n=1 Tax=Staphylococcus saprophyticus TaxID=29385 RepID=UPI00289D3F37|nr:hypothetical protein [Staphylococcus saprophyticus]